MNHVSAQDTSHKRYDTVLMVLLAVALLAGCATGRAAVAPGAPQPPAHKPRPTARGTLATAHVPTAREASAPEQSRASWPRSEATEEAPETDWEKGWGGWPDGVGPGRPYTVPMSVDYFQGLLLSAGVPNEALPREALQLGPEEAVRLLPHVLESEATLANFGPKRIAVHLLLEVWRRGAAVPRRELHARLARYQSLLLLRPDGYLVQPYSGHAVQKVGVVRWGDDGALRSGTLEVGPFYAAAKGWLFPVDDNLEVLPRTRAAGRYSPDDGVLLPALEGASQAVLDTVQGLLQLASHPLDTLAGLTRLPGAMGELLRGAPEHWKSYMDKPPGERVRLASRLVTTAVLVLGSSGAGAARAAAAGTTLSKLALPVLKLLPDGRLALSVAAVVPVGRAVAVAAPGVAATYVVHMAQVGANAAAGGSAGNTWKPPLGGPGQWVRRNESMSPRAQCYQCQVSSAPPGWVYRVWRNGKKADFDDFKGGRLLDAKGPGYDKFFDKNLKAKPFFRGADEMVEQANRQLRVANGVPIRWHVAEPRMVDIIKKLFETNKIHGIEVVHTPFMP